MSWTAEQVRRLYELTNKGKSAAQAAVVINQEFGTTFSRCSCLGRLNRDRINAVDGVPDYKPKREKAVKVKKPPAVFKRSTSRLFDEQDLNTLNAVWLGQTFEQIALKTKVSAVIIKQRMIGIAIDDMNYDANDCKESDWLHVMKEDA